MTSGKSLSMSRRLWRPRRCRPYTGDPFDRVIVALVQAQMLTIITSDENIAKYPGVRTIC